MNRSLNFPIKAEDLIPHRMPMCLIVRLLSYDGLQGVVESTLLPGSIGLREDGSIEQLVMVELLAQAFAAVKGYADLLDGKPFNKGFLVGVKQFVFQRSAYGKDRLFIFITKTGDVDEFALAEGRVTCGDEVLAFGNVMVRIPRED
jgi:3-hydroxyacyl-[acyl-carrier-protein] dehydratase